MYLGSFFYFTYLMGAFEEISTVISDYFKKSLIYIGVFILFTINITALSISLQCNRDRYFSIRLISAIFAFLFGIIYIGFNYIQYRVNIKKDPCQLCGNDPFPL